jgi:5-methyltetrahydrofolate--homocysteine methyltransferase
LKPYGDLDFEAAVSLFAEMVKAGARAGADCILIETMSDTYELKAAVLAAKENSDLPVFATLIFDEKGRLLTGGDIPSAVALLEGLGVDAFGLNCGMGPVQMAPLLEELLRLYLHAGHPQSQCGVPAPRRRNRVWTSPPPTLPAKWRRLPRSAAFGRLLRHHSRSHLRHDRGLPGHSPFGPCPEIASAHLFLRRRGGL